MIRVVKVPPGLQDAAGIGTPDVFANAVGKIFRIEGFDEYGHLELFILRSSTTQGSHPVDSIWIEPEFVETVDDATPTI